MDRECVAVVGAGVAGLTAAYVLQQRYDVTLFEAEPRLGGHAHTHDVVPPDGPALPVDSGFIVYNERTYPHLVRLFRELGVTTQPTEMSMSIRCEGCGTEYAGGRGVRGILASPRTVARPAYLRMLGEVRRFHRAARDLLAGPETDRTLGEFVAAGGYSAYFTSHFLVPVVSAVWSAAPDVALRYPATYLFRFLDHHGMLSVSGSPPWRTVVGGSRAYVERAAKHLTAVRTSAGVAAITRDAGGAALRLAGGETARFDRVVVATHADTALRLLRDATTAEQQTLGAFTYSRNETSLHTDARTLPRARGAAASWNYLLPSCAAAPDRVLVSYDMNRLQHLPTRMPLVVTLNGESRVDPRSVLAKMVYEHPIYTRESVAAQRHLPALNDGVTAFAGAYHGWGFHEDGCRSGVEAAGSLGVDW